jgi:hypothetical protein
VATAVELMDRKRKGVKGGHVELSLHEEYTAN